jgi:tetratricopeptide (TPR) repeat protein
VDPVSVALVGWFVQQAATAGERGLERLLRGDKQANALRAILTEAIEGAVDEVVVSDERAVVRDALRGEGHDTAVIKIRDVLDLQDAVLRLISPRLATLADQGYQADVGRLAGAITQKIRDGIENNAARGGPLAPVADLLRYKQQAATGQRIADAGERTATASEEAARELKEILRTLREAESQRRFGGGLPAVAADFVGRRAAVSELASRVAAHNPAHITMAIHVIDGMAGVGKTTLALHIAHQVADRYPDGAFFIDLHGYTPGIEPVSSEAALDQLLRNAGLSAEAIPAGLAARQARWRSVMSDRKALVLLDNARDSSQTRPLLPMAAGCLVLVTSRRRLTGLPEATPFALEVLPLDEAASLFVEAVGGNRSVGRPDVDNVVQLCGRLPLAVRIAAGRLRHEPATTVADLVAELADQRDRLEYLSPEEAGVGAAFAVSVHRLPPDRQRGLWIVGLHPGPDVRVPAVAALANISVRQAHALLRDLNEHHLVQPGSQAQLTYYLHDLIRDFLRISADAKLSADEQSAAFSRLTEYYRHAVAGDTQDWLAAERDNLVAFAKIATVDAASAICLPAAAGLRILGYWHHAGAIYQAVHTTFTAVGNRRGQADAHHGIGDIASLEDDYPAASQHYRTAYEIHMALGNRPGEADALQGLAGVAHAVGDYATARQQYQHALEIHTTIGNARGQAEAWWGLGELARLTGDYAAAHAQFRKAYEINSEIGDPKGQAHALWGLADVARLTGKYAAARRHYQASQDIYTAIGDRLGEADALLGLATVAVLANIAEDYPAARIQLQTAYDMFTALGDQRGQAEARWGFGELARLTGDYAIARDEYQIACDIYTAIGNRLGEASTLWGLGQVAVAAGEPDRARMLWEQALVIFDQLGNPVADEIHIALDHLEAC